MTDEERSEPVLGASANTGLIAAYERYPQAERTILEALSIVYQPINQTTLQKILNPVERIRHVSAQLRGCRSLMTAYFGAHPPHPEVALFLAEQWLYRGDPGQAEALLPDDSPHSLSLLGWARFIQGRHEEASVSSRRR